MVPLDMLSLHSLKTVSVLLAGFVAWKVSLGEVHDAKKNAMYTE